MVERKRGSDRYDSDEGYDSKRKRGGFIVKILCPYYTAGAVIGKGGERIKEIKDRSGANIEISRHDARFPNTEERVISIDGERDELQSALRYLNENIRDADTSGGGGGNSSRFNDEDSMDRRRKTCKILVSDSSMAMIIGRGGDNIRDIKKEYGVQINTSKRHETPRDIDERIVTIEGEDRDVDRCLDELICQICTDDRSRMKFHVDYSDQRYHREVGGRGFGGGRYGGGHGRGGGGGRNRSRSRSRSRGRGSPSPRRRSPSPRRRSASPRRRSPSPRRGGGSPSPRRRSPSPRRRSPSPRRRSPSPPRKRRSPTRSKSRSKSRSR